MGQSDALPLATRPSPARTIRLFAALACAAPAAALLAILGLAVSSPDPPAWAVMALALLGLLASAGAAALVTRHLAARFAALARERDAFCEEFARLSKSASLGQIASSIAHDLNNPLAIMNEEAGWLSDLLDRGGLDRAADREEFRTSVAQIRQQIRRASEFTRRLLDWTRTIGPPGGVVDLEALLTGTVYLLERDVSAGNVRIVREAAPEPPMALGSEAELRQVFLHLMKNAVDAMQPAGGTLTIATRRASDSVSVRVADTGPGIAPEVADRLFDPFVTTKPPGQGTGLGLAISRWIVERAGGRIEVERTPGAGAAFLVRLPAAPAAPAPAGGTR
jgi:two-component system NtrC family sensor kinase